MSILQMMMAGLSLEYEGVITSGGLHIATRDGEAMFFHDSIDFSTYAGTDGGSTPYRFVFTDSAGKVATAYGGAAGGGEALGSELLTNGSMEAGDPVPAIPTGWTARSPAAELSSVAEERTGGTGSRCLSVLGVGNYPAAQQAPTASTGQLLKAVAWGKNVVDVKGYFAFIMTGGNVNQFISSSTWAERTKYATVNGDLSNFAVYGGEGSADQAYFDDVSLKALTDIPATGLHLMSTKNGTTRNMANVETGFNPNAIVGVKIYG